MREYRGKRVDNGDWVKGSYFLDADQQKTYIIQYQVVSHYADAMFRPSVYLTEVLPESVGQSIGIKDENGVEIYGEGDIYKDAKGVISIVKMAVDGWALFPVEKGPVRNLYWHNVCNDTKGEVIGNTTDSPNLLESPK